MIFRKVSGLTVTNGSNSNSVIGINSPNMNFEIKNSKFELCHENTISTFDIKKLRSLIADNNIFSNVTSKFANVMQISFHKTG